jgi:lactoylglutathione lyase
VTSTLAELQTLANRLVEFWNQRDEEAFAALFGASAEYVTGQGTHLRGRREIARLLREAEPGLHVVVSEPPSVQCDAGGGTVWFGWTAARPSGAARQGRITCVVARHDGRWLIEALENHEDDPGGRGSVTTARGGVRIEHVALWVRDLERMREFYVASLGGDSGALYENPRTGFRSYFISFGGGARLELMGRRAEPETAPGSRDTGYAHVAFSLGSRAAVDAAVARLEAQGVAIVGRARVTGDGYYEAVIADPEGNRVELME